MKKQKNFIGRLLHRNNEEACEDVNKQGVDDQVMDGKIDPGNETEVPAGERKPEAMEGPTMCKNGKLYRARLRNGRWETMGSPIGDC